MSVEELQHELEQLKENGLAKRRRRQGELEKNTATLDQFRQKWRKVSEKRALHPYIKAVTIEDHLVPSKILSKQAKLAQLLHCMEIYRIQKNLIEKEQREMAELYCHQAAQEEEQASEVSLELMNQLCQADSALRELKEKMRKLGMNVDDNDEEKGCSGARVIVGLYHHFRM